MKNLSYKTKMSPEKMRELLKTQAIDLDSLSCFYYFILSWHMHLQNFVEYHQQQMFLCQFHL